MKVIEIFGDYDYAALNFENAGGLKTIKKQLADGLKEFDHESEEYPFSVRVHEFEGDVSEQFISFIKNDICDYDLLKHHDFFIIE